MATIAMINFSGNVGKSTLTNELFRPRLKNYKFWSVETLNTDNSPEAEKVKAEKYNSLLEEIILDHDNAFLDIGASNVELFMNKMNQNIGSQDDFDLFIVPIIPDDKQIADSLKTIEVLNALNVPSSKIVVIFNRIENVQSSVEDVEVFQDVIFYHEKMKNFTLCTDLAVYESLAFSLVRLHDKTVLELANDKNDYGKLSRNKELPREERKTLVNLKTAKGLSLLVHANLNDVFHVLNKKYPFISSK